MDAVEVYDLKREYRMGRGLFRWRKTRTVEALRGISFSVRHGELFGILGPNGAGKTTTVKILSTLLLPTGGSAKVLGYDVVTQAAPIRARIGFIFGGDRGFYGRVSARENLRYFANLYGLDPRITRRRIEEVLDQVGLRERGNDRVETFSRGMKQRLHIARALLHDPQLIFLDEPTIGIDPVGARELRETIAALKAAGKTMLLTTHYMFEADQLCDRIAIINGGRLVALDTPRRLRAVADDLHVLEITLYAPDPAVLERISRLPGVVNCHVTVRDGMQVVLLQAGRGREMVPAVAAALEGVPHGGIVVREPTLEDAYLRIVSAAGRPDARRAVTA